MSHDKNEKKSVQQAVEAIVSKGQLALSDEDCAKRLLDGCPPDTRDYHVNFALESNIDLATYIRAGLIVLAQQGEGPTAIAYMDDSWTKHQNKQEVIHCVVCNKEIQNGRMGQKVCGSECGNKLDEKNQLEVYNKKNPRCIWCENSFTATSLHQLHCSPDCFDEQETEQRKRNRKVNKEEVEKMGKRGLTPLKVASIDKRPAMAEAGEAE